MFFWVVLIVTLLIGLFLLGLLGEAIILMIKFYKQRKDKTHD